MATRLLVSLNFRDSAQLNGGPTFEQVARNLVERGAALGGRVVAWENRAFALDFALDGLQDALDLVAEEPLPPALSAGLAHGEVEALVDGGSRVTLCAGPALRRARDLSRLARPGEVLIEPALWKASSGEILTMGSRLGRVRGKRLKGLKLDLSYPQRSLVCQSVERLGASSWLGGEFPKLETGEGGISVVYAEAGHGGSRFFLEQKAQAGLPHLLVIAPRTTGEPLGALRHALERDIAEHGKLAAFSEDHAESLQSLLSGEGVEHDAAAALLRAYLAARGMNVSPIVFVEHAGDVDADSLEVVAEAGRGHGVRLVLRLEPGETLPSGFEGLPMVHALRLRPFSQEDATAFVAQQTAGALDASAADLWAKRGSGSPLGTRVALEAALDSGLLVWDDAGVRARTRLSGYGEPKSVDVWIQKRLMLLDPDQRTFIDALTVLGGDAALVEVVALMERAGRRVHSPKQLVSSLVRTHWLTAAGAYVALPSRSHQRAASAALSERRKQLLHQSSAALKVEAEQPLVLTAAATHAALAGNVGKAALLARRAAASARACGLERTAMALQSFAETGKLRYLVERGLTGERRDLLVPSDRPPEALAAPPESVEDATEWLEPEEPEAVTSADIMTESETERRERETALRMSPVHPEIDEEAVPSRRSITSLVDVVLTESLDAPEEERPDASASASASAVASIPASAGDVRAMDSEPIPSVAPSSLPPVLMPGFAAVEIPAAPAVPGAVPPMGERGGSAVPWSAAPGSRSPVSASPSPASASSPVDEVIELEDLDDDALEDAGLESAAPGDELEVDEQEITAPSLYSNFAVAKNGVPRESPRPPSDVNPVARASASRLRTIANSDLAPARAVSALQRGDGKGLSALAAELRTEGHDLLSERLEAMAHLAKGDVGEALRLLRGARARAEEREPRERTRAALALGVALAAAGRSQEALLEALDGLARARQAHDERGEMACARFVAQLSRAAGDESVAEAWESLT